MHITSQQLIFFLGFLAVFAFALVLVRQAIYVVVFFVGLALALYVLSLTGPTAVPAISDFVQQIVSGTVAFLNQLTAGLGNAIGLH